MCVLGHQERLEPFRINIDLLLVLQMKPVSKAVLIADPLQVNWLADGCETRQKGAKHTECLCNHLTYFSVLVVRRGYMTSTHVTYF